MGVFRKFHSDKSYGRYGETVDGCHKCECDGCGRCAWLCKVWSYVMVALILREELYGCGKEWGGLRYQGHSNRSTRAVRGLTAKMLLIYDGEIGCIGTKHGD